MAKVIVDTGPLVAVANPRDPHHREARAILTSANFEPVVPLLCVAEVAYLVGEARGAEEEARVIDAIRRLPLEPPTAADWDRITELMRTYADWPLGTVDASVVALAERLNADTVVTLDRRHFVPIRPRHCESFRILP